jgi:hypothetical protein
MIVASGNAAMDLDLNRLKGTATGKLETLQFNVAANSYFTILVFNDQFRGPELGSIALMPKNSVALPASLGASLKQLVVEWNRPEEAYEMAVRDGKTGFTFFNIQGHSYDYNAKSHLLRITEGKLLISDDFAKQLGRPADSGAIAGSISVATTMSPIEIAKVVNGGVQSIVMPAHSASPNVGTIPGPDVIVGDLPSMSQGGSSGTQVGLEIGTTSCNQGVENLDWFQLPNTDHPVIPQNFYRMSGGADNTERFEQVGQSWLKHAFTALTENVCSLGCNGVGGSHLGSGCSDPYSASLNGSQSGLGSRAWVNPFTGAYPSTANNHSGHTHTGTSHRILVEASDLNTTLNAGASYFAEGQYVTPHEYAWCQAHPGQCNMYNNVSYRKFSVSGTTSFTFSPVSSTVRTLPAINGWAGSTLHQIEPDPGNDGIGIVGYKVTNPSAGVWHYEYAVYNENLDRGVQSFSIPIGCGVNVSNIGFHAPLNPPAFANDGTFNNAGYSNAPWTVDQSGGAVTWSSETFAQNQNANALRWGTLYNFRFDSDHPPQAMNATLGYFKNGSPSTVAVQGPMPDASCNPLQIVSAVSRKEHGAAGDFDVALPLSGSPGVECRDGGGAYTFVITFTNVMATGNAAVTGGTGTVQGTPVIAGNIMTVELAGVTNAQTLTVTLSNLSDTFGHTLADTPLNAVMLIGDTTGNQVVNASDVSQIKAAVGATVDGSNFRADLNINGIISSTDVAEGKSNLGQSVP